MARLVEPCKETKRKPAQTIFGRDHRRAMAGAMKREAAAVELDRSTRTIDRSLAVGERMCAATGC
jgi:hypothetical protein